MISFIIYEREKKTRDLYTKIIKKFLYTSKDYYQIFEFDKYNNDTKEKLKKIEGKRIYLMGIDVPGKNGLDLARKIRKAGDILSQIILITNNKKMCIPKYTKHTLLLNIIYKEEDMIDELLESLQDAYEITTKHSAFTFSSFDEVYRIPYEDIYYIEKNICDDVVTIYTKDDSYLLYISIIRIMDELKDDPRFFKCHRSCILNIYKVTSYNKKDNIVTFDNGITIDSISRSKRKSLADRLLSKFVKE